MSAEDKSASIFKMKKKNVALHGMPSIMSVEWLEKETKSYHQLRKLGKAIAMNVCAFYVLNLLSESSKYEMMENNLQKY